MNNGEKNEDKPYALFYTKERNRRVKKLNEIHIKKLTKYVENLRNDKDLIKKYGDKLEIPYFDPCDGGENAKALFLLEATGPQAVLSGFISRNNPDQTAENMCNFLSRKKADISRKDTLIWNIVPWYIGDEDKDKPRGKKIRPPKQDEIEKGLKCLMDLLKDLTRLKAIVLMGKKAQKVKSQLEKVKSQLAPEAEIFSCRHPSPQSVNMDKGKKIIKEMKQARKRLYEKNSSS